MPSIYAIFFTSVAWIFLDPLYHQPHPAESAGALALAYLAAIRFSRHSFKLAFSWKLTCALIPLLTAAGLLSEGSIRMIALSAVIPLLWYTVWYRSEPIRCVAQGPLVIAAVLLLQAPFVAYLRWVTLLQHEVPFAARIVAPFIARIYGQAATNGASLLAISANRISEFVLTWDALAAEPLLLFFLGIAFLWLLRGGTGSAFVWIALGFMSFAIVRVILLVILAVEFNYPAIFYNPYLLVLSLTPLPPVVALVMERSTGTPRKVSAPLAPPQIRTVLPVAGIALWTGLVLGLGATYHDPGRRRPSKILIDENHSEWAWTKEPLDREHYGVRSVYNYRSLLDYLRAYYAVDQNHRPLTAAGLRAYDLLVVKMPTEPYSPAEREVIHQFVSEGGGLLLIGDHTNVFGSSLYINQILERYGICLRYDATYDLHTSEHSHFVPRGRFRHPIIRNVERLEFASSCTIEGTLRTQHPLVGYALKAVSADYSDPSFFPSNEYVNGHVHAFGRFIQAAALPVGKGRISVFSDSTIFSNFYLFLEGRAELLLGLVEWTGRENSLSWCPTLLQISGVVGLVALLTYLLARRTFKAGTVLLAYATALVGWSLGSLAGDAFNAAAYAPPVAVRPPKRIAFDLSHCSTMLSTIEAFPVVPKGIKATSYSTLFIWTQRAGFQPCVQRSLERSVKGSCLVLLVNPDGPFSQRELALLDRYMADGGVVLILDEWYNVRSTAPQILGRYGLKRRLTGWKRSPLHDSAGNSWGTALNPVVIAGGEPWLSVEKDLPVFAVKQVGCGLLAFFGAGRTFSDVGLGYYKSVPTEAQRKRADLLYRLLDALESRESRSPF